MIKSICLSVALLSILLLVSAGTASARTRGVLDTNLAGSATQLIAIASFGHPTQALNISAISMFSGDGDDHHDGDGDKDDHDRDHDRDHDKDHGPKPTPEPSTILSFGAALLIGGGVLASRRLRGTRK
jgi:hypothetical protein